LIYKYYYDQKKGGWYPLGKDVVAKGYNQYVSLAIASDNTIYVASYDDKDLSWKIVGLSDHVAPGNVGSLAIAIDADNKPVLAFADLYKEAFGKATVLKYYIA